MATVIDGSASVTINNGAVLGITSGTAVASTSGTSIDFTSIPSWVKRVTVMLNGVSTNGSSNLQMQVGAGSVVTSGYVGGLFQSPNLGGAFTSGVVLTYSNSSTYSCTGQIILTLQTSNTWVASFTLYVNTYVGTNTGGSSIALGGTLDRLRITTANGTDTFDAGSINILYEG